MKSYSDMDRYYIGRRELLTATDDKQDANKGSNPYHSLYSLDRLHYYIRLDQMDRCIVTYRYLS